MYIQWNTHIKYTKKHKWKYMAGTEFEPGTPASLVMCSATELFRSINIHGPSRLIYHIPPLTSFCPLRNSQQTHVYPVRTYWLTNLTNACIVTVPNVSDKRGNIEINNFLYRRRKICEPIKNMEITFFKIT